MPEAMLNNMKPLIFQFVAVGRTQEYPPTISEPFFHVKFLVHQFKCDGSVLSLDEKSAGI